MSRSNSSGVKGLYKGKGGRYRIDLRCTDRDGTPQRHREVLPLGITAGAARLRAQAVLENALAGRPTKPQPGEVARLSQAFDAYLAWVETNRPKAHKQRKSQVKVWLATVGDVPVAKLDGALLESYKSKRLATGETAPATINKGLMIVKHMSGLAARSGWAWMTRERAAVIREVGMLKEPPGRQRPIKPKELDALLAAFTRKDSRFARRVVLADLLTGCRLGELLSLRAGAIDFKRQTIDLSETKQNRNHQIAITPPLATLLKEALADWEPGEQTPANARPVFRSRLGRAYTVDGFSKQFAKVAKRAGVPDITFHDLRRHVGTMLINSGERLEVVSKLLGHSNVAVTQRSYAHLTTDATRAAFAHLAEIAPALPSAAGSASPKRRKTA
ncbi:MAG TPA: site-specific integrase [Polyangiaceae bacterium]|nr:site-specific integrase [Polyangiaceae bacterium]